MILISITDLEGLHWYKVTEVPLKCVNTCVWYGFFCYGRNFSPVLLVCQRRCISFVEIFDRWRKEKNYHRFVALSYQRFLDFVNNFIWNEWIEIHKYPLHLYIEVRGAKSSYRKEGWKMMKQYLHVLSSSKIVLAPVFQ